MDDDDDIEEAGEEDVWEVGAGADGARAPDGEWSPVFGGVLLGPPGPLEDVVKSCGEAIPELVVVLSANLQDVDPDRFVTVLLLRAGDTGPAGCPRGCKCEARR